MKLIFISPCYNAEENLESLIESVRNQSDNRWHHILVDDISSDESWKKMNEIVGKDKRFTLIRNSEKKYALKNIIEPARTYQDAEDVVIGTIDGDDSLCNIDTVKIVLEEYEKGADVVWTGHRWDINSMNISRAIPKNVNPYQWPWCSSHFRTFRSSLLKKIDDKNFKHVSGEWFKRGYDQALMLPLLFLTKKRSYIDKICYLYNIDSSSIPEDKRNWCEMEQISTINMVRARGFLK
jgi:glycosyltransferase involved in cell wall biosynthesis